MAEKKGKIEIGEGTVIISCDKLVLTNGSIDATINEKSILNKERVKITIGKNVYTLTKARD